jgi:hypothetical protein
MKKSEKILLAIFSMMFVIIVGGGVVKWAWNTYQEVHADSARLRGKLQEMAANLSQSEEWKKRYDWLEESMPQFTGHEDASSKLFDAVQKQAETAGLSIGAREMLPQRTLQEGESAGNYDQASVKLTFTDVGEKELFSWMHGLAVEKPHKFIGITRMQLQPGGKEHTVSCEVDVTQFFISTEAPKVAKVQ